MSDSTINLPEVVTTAKAPTASNRPSAPYARRIIRLTFVIGKTGEQFSVTGLRCFVQLGRTNMPSPDRLLLRVYGLTLNHVNALTKAGTAYRIQEKNSVVVEAGDEISGLTKIFQGDIWESYPEFNEPPDSAFVVMAQNAIILQLKPVPPVSFNGPTPVTTALTRIIQPAGLTLEANGVNTVLAYPYFPGTTWSQMNRAITAADVYGYHDSIASKFAVWPKDGSRQGGAILIAPETGMIGYPEFMQARVRARTLFSPTLQGLGPGIQIQIKSQLAAANGKFTAYQVDYSFDRGARRSLGDGGHRRA
jgi:hypothetical protein